MMLTDLTIVQARAGLQRRDFSAAELVQAHVDAAVALNPRLNAFITLTPELALAQAAGADMALADGTAGPARRHSAGHKGSFLHAGRAHHRGQPHFGTFHTALMKAA